jgi:hypothetical protein
MHALTVLDHVPAAKDDQQSSDEILPALFVVVPPKGDQRVADSILVVGQVDTQVVISREDYLNGSVHERPLRPSTPGKDCFRSRRACSHSVRWGSSSRESRIGETHAL